MKTIYSDDHNLHSDLLDPRGHQWMESAECPARANNVAAAIRGHDVGEILEPQVFDERKYLSIHEPDYLEFLKTVWEEWAASDNEGSNARPDTFVGNGMRYADTECVGGKLLKSAH